PTRQAARELSVGLTSPRELALGSPLVTGSSSQNAGTGAISAGTMLSVYEADGTTLQSTFATAGALEPPLLIRFNDPATSFDVLDSRTMTVLTGYDDVAFTPGQQRSEERRAGNTRNPDVERLRH